MKVDEFDGVPYLTETEVEKLSSIRLQLARFNRINKEDHTFLLELLDNYLFGYDKTSTPIIVREAAIRLKPLGEI